MGDKARGQKGLPKRTRNEAARKRRSRSFARGEEIKRLRRAAQRQREEANRALREEGLPTPWEEAKRERFDRRHAKEK